MSPKTTIKYLIVVIAILFAAALLLKAQTPAKPTVPTISIELKAKLFKAQAQQLQAQHDFEQVQKTLQEKFAALQAVIQEANKVCGDKASLQLDKDGDPVCLAKPPAPTPAVPAKK